MSEKALVSTAAPEDISVEEDMNQKVPVKEKVNVKHEVQVKQEGHVKLDDHEDAFSESEEEILDGEHTRMSKRVGDDYVVLVREQKLRTAVECPCANVCHAKIRIGKYGSGPHGFESLSELRTHVHTQECLKHQGLLEPGLRPRQRLGKRKVYVVNNPKYKVAVSTLREVTVPHAADALFLTARRLGDSNGWDLGQISRWCGGRIVAKTIVYVVEYKGGGHHRAAISSGANVNITRSHTNRKSNQRDQEGEHARDEPNIQRAFLDAASVCKRGLLIQVFSLSSELDQRLRLAELLSRQLGGRQLLTAWLAHGDGATRAERGAAAGGTQREGDGSEEGSLLRSHV
ncbi:hypothetical protein FGB62_140g026 [Gracilaria domingensis]|nr:hypothetical protein FGB62_140g026 [Gracilaria domingensis]